MASPTVANNAKGLNLDSSVSSLAIPFASSGSTQVITVFVGVKSAIASVLSVTDDSGVGSFINKGAVRANQEVDYSQGQYFKNPILRNYVQGECWTKVAASGTVTKVTVTLTSGAKFAVEVRGFSGSAVGNAGTASLASSNAPTVTVTTATNGSWLVSGFASVTALNETATAGTLDDQIAGSGIQDEGGMSLTAAHILQATAGPTTVTLTPANKETLDGVTFAVPATYAVTAIEVKG